MPGRVFCMSLLPVSIFCVCMGWGWGSYMVGGRQAERNQLIKNYLIWPSPGFCGCSNRKSGTLSSANMEEIQSLHSSGAKIPLAMS